MSGEVHFVLPGLTSWKPAGELSAGNARLDEKCGGYRVHLYCTGTVGPSVVITGAVHAVSCAKPNLTAGTVRAMEDSGKQCYRITNGSRLSNSLRSAHEGDRNIKP